MAPIEKLKQSMDSKRFDHKRDEISAISIINRVMPIIKDWFSRTDKNSKAEIDDFIRIMFEYVTSRTENSGRFVIAK